MQILITLREADANKHHSIKKAKQDLDRFHLKELLLKLEKDGYRINTLYGRFIFDEKRKEVVDCGEPGKIVPACMELVDSIFATGGKLAVIFTSKKYIVFADTFFIAIHFCNMRRVRPLSVNDVLENYDELIIKESKNRLEKLYINQFEKQFSEHLTN